MLSVLSLLLVPLSLLNFLPGSSTNINALDDGVMRSNINIIRLPMNEIKEESKYDLSISKIIFLLFSKGYQ